MPVYEYNTILLFLIEGCSKRLPLHRPEVRLNQTFIFYWSLKNVIWKLFLICLWMF